ncbi:hypothetical protein [Geomonas paludis]|uniref:GIY-YIG domain-containing protein n=1 Tax=Geomonas paludis TaxID=2740185 RepID=A0A6V8MU58_9BACT|nr:hypothetical protein [Geomonas paludis]GFO63640.1 hypothetical protein GMPD_15590 [Geomonas paludis]
MNAADYDALKLAVDDLNIRYPRPNLNLVLNSLAPVATNDMWQNADKKGLYFLFDASGTLQYIGKASFNSNIGIRLGVRFSCKDCRCLDDRFSSISMLATIALEDERAFEASSIEEYLITELQPPLNVVGIR